MILVKKQKSLHRSATWRLGGQAQQLTYLKIFEKTSTKNVNKEKKCEENKKKADFKKCKILDKNEFWAFFKKITKSTIDLILRSFMDFWNF